MILKRPSSNEMSPRWKSFSCFPNLPPRGFTLPSYVAYKYLGRVPYPAALELQHHLVRKRIKSRELGDLEPEDPDILLIVEHDPVYTTGRRFVGKTGEGEKERLQALGASYHETLRGGQTTFHGPGQLVGYPIMNLKRQELNLKVSTTQDTGVWVGDDKICAIGVQVQRYISSHGFALNCSTDLSWFNHIVPCGLHDKGVTTLTKELLKRPEMQEIISKHEITVSDTIPYLLRAFGTVFERDPLPLSQTHSHLSQEIDDFIQTSSGQ
ncbi:lipoyltransferase [Basidiobolus meristosporus CBS 931.73]|uniref:lipoyl(octanoyl) transferase n=1 Tax=Basidiobolus meristosporus CBS 931.73 TaxID=1314790 RepID=A0A1Y1YNY1_9FUNG|nr:lipoyltransferase [Basidiobolus meristosporus CBS 931.73]|eukprot:ORX99737.1 lipoyltransferase [Basidiobolus meristosporus CBS 931.73]